MVKENSLQILDVTIRDGSYAVDFSYTPQQVAEIAGLLYIEVSHGVGLGAAEVLGLAAAAPDIAYVRAARQAVQRAQIGVIALSEAVATRAHLDEVLDEIDFIRFAANCHQPEAVEPSIAYVKKRRPELPVFFQLMRSARRRDEEILAAAARIEGMGAETLCLVDTAGHYTPRDVARLVGALRDQTQMRIGFHGHNNLALATANTFAAAEAGAGLVDASLRGIGRSPGNAQLEAVVSLLHRIGLAREVDLETLVYAGEKCVLPLMPPACGVPGLDIITGDANIDLYPPEALERIATEAGVNFIDFLYELARDASIVEADVDAIRRTLERMGVDPARITLPE